MSERPAIELQGVGKRYTLYPSPMACACDALGLAWLLPGKHRRFQQFWALRNINLTLPRGARIGVIGRNGAGKSTLLKLITRNIQPTEGTVEVNGEVQALLQAGTGMHPEFTGYENIEAALTYQGLNAAQIRDAVEDIKEFTELGAFLDQPFKTYSTGMQARLAFAAATVLTPDILIVDELLGVGDGYFFSKSIERMTKLIKSGASVLLVSHSNEHILRFCDRAIWVDRGQIVQQGEALEVIKEYDRYLRLLEERRLLAANARRQSAANAGNDKPSSDELVVRFRVAPNARLKVGEIILSENDRPQDRLHVGGPQDSTRGNNAGLRLDIANAWSAPLYKDQRMYRELRGVNSNDHGDVVFPLHLFDPLVTYGVEFEYCLEGSAIVEVRVADQLLQSTNLHATSSWQRANVFCASREQPCTTIIQTGQASTLKAVHWPGCLGGLRIERVRLLDTQGREAALFAYGERMTLEMQIHCDTDGVYPLTPALTICRRGDGLSVSQHIGPRQTWTLRAGDTVTARLNLAPLQLCNDSYVVGMGLFRKLDPIQVDQPERYDMLDRSVEFAVHGREPYRRGVFQHPGDWEVQHQNVTRQLKSA